MTDKKSVTKVERLKMTFDGTRVLTGKHNDTGVQLWAKISIVAASKSDEREWKHRMSIHSNKECTGRGLPVKVVDLATVPLEMCPDSHGDLSTLVYKAWKMHGFELMKDGESAKSKPLSNLGRDQMSTKKRGRQATEEEDAKDAEEKQSLAKKQKTVTEREVMERKESFSEKMRRFSFELGWFWRPRQEV